MKKREGKLPEFKEEEIRKTQIVQRETKDKEIKIRSKTKHSGITV